MSDTGTVISPVFLLNPIPYNPARGYLLGALPPNVLGTFKVTGVIERFDIPGEYRVRLYDRATGAFLAETMSDPAGNYEFLAVPYKRLGYYTVGLDDSDTPVNGAIADYLTPDSM